MTNRTRCLLFTVLAALALPVEAQWTNRYPRLDGYGHHVYLEGYELPLLTNGPIDAVAAPDGRTIAFASRGWLWLFDRETGIARRITSGPGLDARPAFSPDGRRLAFVRDHDNDTSIVLLDLDTGEERGLVDTPAIDIDPAFTPDGGALYYVSAEEGDFDVWVVGLDGAEAERLTTEAGLEMTPTPLPDGGFVYLAKTRGGVDELRWHRNGTDSVLLRARIASQAEPAVSPDGRIVAVNVPAPEAATHLVLVDLERPHTPMRIARNARLPLTPAFDADGREVLFSEADDRQRLRLYAAPVTGGPAAEIEIAEWDWGVPTGTVRIRTRVDGEPGFAASRLSAWTGGGHPLVAETGMTRLDGQSGRPYFYSAGDVEITVPAGEVRVVATRGLETVPNGGAVEVPAGGSALVELSLGEVWPDRGAWASGDHHFHLNYGGAYELAPAVLELEAMGERLDVPTPLTANLHNRYEDERFWGWQSTSRWPLLRFGQEIRSHFLGHLGTIGITEMIWPWVWGPGYEVYGQEDRPNADTLAQVRAQNGIGYYVHPVVGQSPFADDQLGRLPVEIVADAVLGDLDALEVVCLWSDEVGTGELWHRFLSLGLPVAPSAGTDVMSNLVRTMAMGTTRVYVHQPNGLSWDSYLEGLRAGRSFVTNGPLLDFRLIGPGGALRPGDVVAAGEVDFELDVYTATMVETVEILVNGQVMMAEAGPGTDAVGPLTTGRTFRGTLALPEGGWVAARAHGGETRWPSMDSYPWAHTGPVWIGSVGSTEPAARRAAAADLLRALDAASVRLEAAYGAADIPRLRGHFERARTVLQEILQ